LVEGVSEFGEIEWFSELLLVDELEIEEAAEQEEMNIGEPELSLHSMPGSDVNELDELDDSGSFKQLSSFGFE